jgi:hypothetical protein
MTSGKFRNEDLSIYFYIKGILNGKVSRILDSYPYNDIENESLIIPCVSIELNYVSDGSGELGASWFKKNWSIDVFGLTDTQRDDISELVYNGLDLAIPIRDYSNGYNKDTGKSPLGADLRIIEYVSPQDRIMKQAYNFNTYQKKKYWRSSISFITYSTGAV